mgnify:CR=1 FL=1
MMIRLTTLVLATVLSLSGQAAPASEGRWKADWAVLNQHEVPDWILDAKLGVQYVGPRLELDDSQMYHWQRAGQRHRLLGNPPRDAHLETWMHAFQRRGVVGVGYVWPQKPFEDLEGIMAAYKEIGAKFLVSMLWGAYPGTEGFLMNDEEVREARRAGLRVGLHYNLIRRDGLPMFGDAGYVDWAHDRLRQSIQQVSSDFVFFDGDQFAPSDYLRTADFLAWFYNWADRNGKAVWVNDDLGYDRKETGEYGDLVDHEGFTVEGVSPKPWINWDILRNEWTCWVNEFGVHKLNGKKWVWEYKKPEDLLLVFIDVVSKGGVWIVQMDNTKTAWENMSEIGAWLKVNGEAIYGTRPYGKPEARMIRLPEERRPQDNSSPWMWRFLECVRIARERGPLYLTRKGQTLYAIHWGWPGESLTIPSVKPPRGAAIRMLGVEQDLAWHQAWDGIVVQTPKTPPCKHAYALRIPLAP